MMDVVTISSKGQIVIPKKFRVETGLMEKDEVLIVDDRGRLIIEKISKEGARKNLRRLLDVIGEKAKKSNIGEDIIEKEVRMARNERN